MSVEAIRTVHAVPRGSRCLVNNISNVWDVLLSSFSEMC